MEMNLRLGTYWCFMSTCWFTKPSQQSYVLCLFVVINLDSEVIKYGTLVCRGLVTRWRSCFTCVGVQTHSRGCSPSKLWLTSSQRSEVFYSGHSVYCFRLGHYLLSFLLIFNLWMFKLKLSISYHIFQTRIYICLDKSEKECDVFLWLTGKKWWSRGSCELCHSTDSVECWDLVFDSLGNGWQCGECSLHGHKNPALHFSVRSRWGTVWKISFFKRLHLL